MGKGDTSGLLLWLRQRIHALGRTFKSGEICKMATGEDLDVQYFLDYVLDKYGKFTNFR
jgi:carboxypeptidase Taq